MRSRVIGLEAQGRGVAQCRLLIPLHVEERVPQIAVAFRVRRIQFDGSRVIGQRFTALAEIAKRIAEIIDGIDVIGFERQSAAVEAQRFLELARAASTKPKALCASANLGSSSTARRPLRAASSRWPSFLRALARLLCILATLGFIASADR